MNIVKCGTKGVYMDIDGSITAVEIRFTNVLYEFTYFHGGEFKTKWIAAEQFTSNDKKKMTVGFHTNGVK